MTSGFIDGAIQDKIITISEKITGNYDIIGDLFAF